MRRLLPLVLVAATGVATLFGYPAPASACSCYGSTQVASTDTLAVNARVLLGDFCGGHRDGLSVTVDGQPATLTDLAQSGGGGEPWLTGITPAPSVGQTVEITYGNLDFEDAQVRLLDVVGPDAEPPVAPEVVIDTDVDPIDLACGGLAEPHAMRITLTELSDNAADVRYVVTATADGETLWSRTVGRFFTPEEIVITEAQGDAFGDVREVCVDTLPTMDPRSR